MVKAKKRMTIFLLALLIAVGTGNSKVRAETRGNILIELTEGGKGTEKDGVVFSYVKAAKWEDESYELSKPFEQSGVIFSQIETAEELKKAAEKLDNCEWKADGTVVTDKDGKAEIKNLEKGVYLLKVTDSGNYEEIAPFITTVPSWNEKLETMDYDVKVIPKHVPATENISEHSVKTGDVQIEAGEILLLFFVSGGVILSMAYRSRKQK